MPTIAGCLLSILSRPVIRYYIYNSPYSRFKSAANDGFQDSSFVHLIQPLIMPIGKLIITLSIQSLSALT